MKTLITTICVALSLPLMAAEQEEKPSDSVTHIDKEKENYYSWKTNLLYKQAKTFAQMEETLTGRDKAFANILDAYSRCLGDMIFLLEQHFLAIMVAVNANDMDSQVFLSAFAPFLKSEKLINARIDSAVKWINQNLPLTENPALIAELRAFREVLGNAKVSHTETGFPPVSPKKSPPLPSTPVK